MTRILSACAAALFTVAAVASPASAKAPLPIYPVTVTGATVTWNVPGVTYVYFTCSGILAGPPVRLSDSPRLPASGSWTYTPTAWTGTVQCNGYAVTTSKGGRDTLTGYLDYWQPTV